MFDYLIVGAGSAGCVLANRLSASGQASVGLLEAGGKAINPLLHIPAGWATSFNNPKVDWGYETQPEPGLNDRQIYWPRGKVMGGSSAINGMVYVRGVPQDFDDWAQAGAVGWSWEDVLPYFKRAERQSTHKDELHGTEGPLHVQDVRDKRPAHEAFIDAMVQQGIPRNPDFNGVDQAGSGYYQFTQNNGRRWSTATAYLNQWGARKNLQIITNAMVERVLFEGNQACGVRVRRKSQRIDYAARHVILCGGAVNSPQLLELSGIGDGQRLARLGIEVVYDLPDVGEHLQDHLLAKVVYGTHAQDSINREVQGVRVLAAGMQWLFNRSGPLTTGSAPVGGFWYTRDGLNVPDVQIHFASGGTLYNTDGRIQAMPVPAMTAVVNQNRPESRGSIHIESAQVNEYPEIRANYLATENDRQTLVQGVRMLQQIFTAGALDEYTTSRISPEPGLNMDDDEALLSYIREDASTVFHPTSTCSIGKVVDPELNVYGVKGLSVADASVMPSVVSGNTNAASIMVAEKAADHLLAVVNLAQ